MARNTTDEVRAATPVQSPSSFAYCSWHERHAWGCRLVQEVADQGSGPAALGLYACPSCREAYDLTPIADQP